MTNNMPYFGVTFRNLLPDDGTIYPEYYNNYNREIEKILCEFDSYAYNRLKSIIQSGEDLVSFEDHGEGHCGYCAQFTGRVYSISGKSRQFPPLPPYARQHGNFHHGCRCAMYPYFSAFDSTVTLHGNQVHAMISSYRPYIDDRSDEERIRYSRSLRALFDRAQNEFGATDYKINHVENNHYDFSFLSELELNKIRGVINIAESNKYEERFRSLGLYNEAYHYRFKIGYVLDEIILQKYSSSINIYDLFVVALVYLNKTAAFRKAAVECFDKFFERIAAGALKDIKRCFSFARDPYLSSNLSRLYGKEEQLDKAVFYAKKAIEADPKNAYLTLALIQLYEKYDPALCVEYCEKILSASTFDAIKKDVLKELEISCGKMANGYVYNKKSSSRMHKPLQREIEAAACAARFLAL